MENYKITKEQILAIERVLMLPKDILKKLFPKLLKKSWKLVSGINTNLLCFILPIK